MRNKIKSIKLIKKGIDIKDKIYRKWLCLFIKKTGLRRKERLLMKKIKEEDLVQRIGLSKDRVYVINGIVLAICLMLVFAKMYYSYGDMIGEKLVVDGVYKMMFGSLKIFDYFMYKLNLI